MTSAMVHIAFLVCMALVANTAAYVIVYESYSDGYPDVCGADFIKYEKEVPSLQACQDLCSAVSSCKFVAYSGVGEMGCGLYKSQCYSWTHTACGSHECFKTYQKEHYEHYGAGYPGACGSDYIRNEVNLDSLQACLILCSAEVGCRFAAYNIVGDRRCGLYRSSCSGQQHAGCTLSQCYLTYTNVASPLTTTTATTTTTTTRATRVPFYQTYGDGYPNSCGSDFIKYEKEVSSLQACQDLCSAESNCKFVAYSSVGELGCGLYKSQCYGQTHTTCGPFECFKTYEKEQYEYYGAGYPHTCGSDYIRNEVGLDFLQDCLGLCSAEASCRFVAYNRLGDRRCGLYKSSCSGQEQTGCTLSQCYTTYRMNALPAP